MKKYENFNIIRQFDVSNYKGLDKEVITHFENPQGLIFPLSISCYGITYPTPNYYIKRFPVRNFILEHIVSGKGYIIINGKKTEVSAGDTYLLKSGENVEYYADPNDPYQKLWVNFNGDFVREMINLYKLRETVYKGVDLCPLFEKLFKLEDISVNFAQIRFEATTLITELLMALAKSVDDAEYLPEIAVTICKELYRQINRPYSLDELSKKLFLSKSEIIRYFKNAYKLTPYQYLLNSKMNYAKTMLQNGTYTVKEIAEHLGFYSAYHFSNTFKQREGLSPTEYRKQIRE